MKDRRGARAMSGDPRNGGTPARSRIAGSAAQWSFVYIFFTNHIPFDAPNRSEPCPRS